MNNRAEDLSALREALNNPQTQTTKLKQAEACFRQLIVLQKEDLALPVLFLTDPPMKNRRKAVVQRFLSHEAKTGGRLFWTTSCFQKKDLALPVLFLTTFPVNNRL